MGRRSARSACARWRRTHDFQDEDEHDRGAQGAAMIGLRSRKASARPSAQDAVLDSRVLSVLAGLLLLVQAPQVLRLPIWLTAVGIGLVALRFVLIRRGRPAVASMWLLPVV